MTKQYIANFHAKNQWLQPINCIFSIWRCVEKVKPIFLGWLLLTNSLRKLTTKFIAKFLKYLVFCIESQIASLWLNKKKFTIVLYIHIFLYGIIPWGNWTKRDFESIFSLQKKKTVRMLTRSPRYGHTDRIFVNNDVLKLSSIFKFEICKFIHCDFYKNKIFHLTPRFFDQSFNPRFNTEFSLSHVRTNLAAYFVLHKGLKT